MDRKDGKIHYHIRWAQIPLLDWQSFSTRVAAERSAKELKRFGETYTIEKHDENCQRCADATKAKSATFGT
jgi:hypothetical protein